MDKEETMRFPVFESPITNTKSILQEVCKLLKDKGYVPINQIVGYILSGDPSYITSYGNARNMIQKLDRNEVLEELLKNYLVL